MKKKLHLRMLWSLFILISKILSRGRVMITLHFVQPNSVTRKGYDDRLCWSHVRNNRFLLVRHALTCFNTSLKQPFSLPSHNAGKTIVIRWNKLFLDLSLIRHLLVQVNMGWKQPFSLPSHNAEKRSSFAEISSFFTFRLFIIYWFKSTWALTTLFTSLSQCGKRLSFAEMSCFITFRLFVILLV